jgi:hypothetical protein
MQLAVHPMQNWTMHYYSNTHLFFCCCTVAIVAVRYRLWNMISDFSASRKEWLHGSFLDLNGADIERDVSEWCKSR